MQATEAALEDAWNHVVARFPFAGYLDKLPHGHIGVARTVTRFLPTGSRILDFGAGPADKTAVLAKLGYQCTAIDDLQDEWHKRGDARQKILGFADEMGIEFITDNLADVPSTATDFDMVMLHDVLEHMHDSPRGLLNDLVARLRPGGYLFVTVPNHVNLRKRIDVLRGRTAMPQFEQFYWYPGPFRGHVREYTRGDCLQLSDALGLEMVEVVGTHHMLDRVPPKALRLYLAASRLLPSTRDTWSMVARKPQAWTPRRELPEAEFRRLTGLQSWSEMERH